MPHAYGLFLIVGQQMKRMTVISDTKHGRNVQHDREQFDTLAHCRHVYSLRKGIQPVKTEWCGTGMVICLEQGANDLHMVQLMCHCHPIISCFIKIQNGLPFW